eukprot:gene31568-38154_t
MAIKFSGGEGPHHSALPSHKSVLAVLGEAGRLQGASSGYEGHVSDV